MTGKASQLDRKGEYTDELRDPVSSDVCVITAGPDTTEVVDVFGLQRFQLKNDFRRECW